MPILTRRATKPWAKTRASPSDAIGYSNACAGVAAGIDADFVGRLGRIPDTVLHRPSRHRRFRRATHACFVMLETLSKRVSSEEWETRVNLAACYRLAAHFRMTDMIYTHISARVPGPEHHFLINAFGLMWDEISASTLVKVTIDGDIVEDPAGNGINRAGYVIHSAVHRARADVDCVMHTHTAAGIAVSAQEH